MIENNNFNNLDIRLNHNTNFDSEISNSRYNIKIFDNPEEYGDNINNNLDDYYGHRFHRKNNNLVRNLSYDKFNINNFDNLHGNRFHRKNNNLYRNFSYDEFNSNNNLYGYGEYGINRNNNIFEKNKFEYNNAERYNEPSQNENQRPTKRIFEGFIEDEKKRKEMNIINIKCHYKGK